MSKKKILKVWPFWVEGIKYHDQYLSEFMVDDHIKTVFACPNQSLKEYSSFSEPNKKKDAYNYNMHFLKFVSLFNKPIPYEFLKFSKFINTYSPDVIHIFGISNFTTIFTFVSIFFSKFKGQIIFNDHSDPNERKNGIIPGIYFILFLIFYKLIVRNKYEIIVPDESSKNEVINRYGNNASTKISVIPLGYDDRIFKFKSDFRNQKTQLRIGFAGKILPPKRIEFLFKAIESFQTSDIELIIAGINPENTSDYQKKLIDYVKEKKITNIKFEKFLPTPKSLAAFYSTLDLAVFPGSISITTFEANGCGCPVIIYNSYSGLEHRVSELRGRLFQDLDELITYIKYYKDLKSTSKIEHELISKESSVYSWRNIKYKYYEKYKFVN